jgi:DNA-binding MarR family transcriptional regulator
MRLIWAIDHELERLSKHMERHVGVTIPQRMCLLLIAQQPDIHPSELASVLHLHRGTLTGILRRLERAGFLTRRLDSQDARRTSLRVTAKGAAVIRRRTGTFEDAVRRLFTTTAPGERAAAERLLAALQGELRLTRGPERPRGRSAA